MEEMQDCFECTDQDMFKAAVDYIYIDEYAKSMSAYIDKCTEDVNASKSITTQANQKPWMINEERNMLKAWNSVFKLALAVLSAI